MIDLTPQKHIETASLLVKQVYSQQKMPVMSK